MKTNVTLKLDADLLREARVLAAEEGRSISALLTDRLEALVREGKGFGEARVLAAEEGRSISALLTDRLEALVRERKAFDKARRRALARLREGLYLQWTSPKSRDELHER